MRFFLTLLILIFNLQSLTKADDINDFQIEGMSTGDSLLDFFSEEKIINGIRENSYSNSDNTFVDTNLLASWFNTYEGIQATFKMNDKNYIIHSMDGGIFFSRDDKACLDKMNEIVDSLSASFTNAEIIKQPTVKHRQDTTGRSTVQGTNIFFENGNISIFCYLWVDPMEYENYVAVSTRTKEFNDWLNNLP
tara:strand:+ start:2577 stop:3152 length:576 start_codon:yes stop_codon:yes gene_type:complete